MSRRYPTAELYEERERDFYRNGNRSERSYDELDYELSRGGTRVDRRPDFLREDYGRTTAGPLAVRGPPHSDFDRPSSRTTRRDVEKDELIIRRGDRDRPRPVEKEETKLVIRGDSPPRRRFEREDIVFRRGEGERVRPRDAEREEIRFRRTPSRGRHSREDDETVILKHEEDETRRGKEHKDSLIIRERERSEPPPRQLVAREKEEFVVRRRETSPPRRDEFKEKEQIIIRRSERSPTPPPPPPPPPEPEPIIRPPIHQEIITHHRHIDHGVIRARSPTPPPPPSPPSPPKEELLEIAIRRRNGHGDFDEDVIYERDIRERHRSMSGPRRPKDMWTEITKDLVIRDAVEARGYDYEETESFFYVMDYLKYEDVLDLVELSDDIRRDRRQRIREIEWERDELTGRRGDDRFYEREVILDSRRDRYR